MLGGYYYCCYCYWAASLRFIPVGEDRTALLGYDVVEGPVLTAYVPPPSMLVYGLALN